MKLLGTNAMLNSFPYMAGWKLLISLEAKALWKLASGLTG